MNTPDARTEASSPFEQTARVGMRWPDVVSADTFARTESLRVQPVSSATIRTGLSAMRWN